LKIVFKTKFRLLRCLKRRSLFQRFRLHYTVYLNGVLYVDMKKFGKCYFFSKLGVGDIPVVTLLIQNLLFFNFVVVKHFLSLAYVGTIFQIFFSGCFLYTKKCIVPVAFYQYNIKYRVE